MAPNYFSGSYPESDVRFLLNPIHVENTPIHLKEALIQGGRKHYSEMLTHENLPSKEYLELFQQALTDNQGLLAKDTLLLAKKILATRPNGVTLVSLARAGTPIGVLLKRVLQKYFNVDAVHYSISIIRDIGIDENALLHILEHHAAESIVFVDGWTGKGVIANQLAVSLKAFEESYQIKIKPELYVLSDLCGCASVSASSEDYLIPSSILNATVSGLISRSVIDKNQLSEMDYHGCYFYKEYLNSDVSSTFVGAIMKVVEEMMNGEQLSAFGLQQIVCDNQLVKTNRRELSQLFLAYVRDLYGIADINLIKPGIGESTRVLLRREAGLLLLKDSKDPSVRHLLYLADSKKIAVKLCPTMPYRAVALIKEHS